MLIMKIFRLLFGGKLSIVQQITISIIFRQSHRQSLSFGSGNQNASPGSSFSLGFFCRIDSIPGMSYAEETNTWKKDITVPCVMIMWKKLRCIFSSSVHPALHDGLCLVGSGQCRVVYFKCSSSRTGMFSRRSSWKYSWLQLGVCGRNVMIMCSTRHLQYKPGRDDLQVKLSFTSAESAKIYMCKL